MRATNLRLDHGIKENEFHREIDHCLRAARFGQNHTRHATGARALRRSFFEAPTAEEMALFDQRYPGLLITPLL
jgi:hypothetical protein